MLGRSSRIISALIPSSSLCSSMNYNETSDYDMVVSHCDILSSVISDAVSHYNLLCNLQFAKLRQWVERNNIYILLYLLDALLLPKNSGSKQPEHKKQNFSSNPHLISKSSKMQCHPITHQDRRLCTVQTLVSFPLVKVHTDTLLRFTTSLKDSWCSQ